MYSFQTTNYSYNEYNECNYDICLQETVKNNVNNYKQLQTITVEPPEAMRVWTASVFYVYDNNRARVCLIVRVRVFFALRVFCCFLICVLLSVCIQYLVRVYLISLASSCPAVC